MPVIVLKVFHKNIAVKTEKLVAYTIIAHFIKPYRDPVHLLTGFRQGFMKRTVLQGWKNINKSDRDNFIWKINSRN